MASGIKCIFIMIFLHIADVPHHYCYTNNKIFCFKALAFDFAALIIFWAFATLKGNRWYVCNFMVSRMLSNDPGVIKYSSPLQEGQLHEAISRSKEGSILY